MKIWLNAEVNQKQRLRVLSQRQRCMYDFTIESLPTKDKSLVVMSFTITPGRFIVKCRLLTLIYLFIMSDGSSGFHWVREFNYSENVLTKHVLFSFFVFAMVFGVMKLDCTYSTIFSSIALINH